MDSIETAKKATWQEGVPAWNQEGLDYPEEMVLITQSLKEVQAIMSSYVGIVRSDLRRKQPTGDGGHPVRGRLVSRRRRPPREALRRTRWRPWPESRAPRGGTRVAVGTFTDGTGNTQAMEATEMTGSWGQALEVTLPANVNPTTPAAGLSGVSCTSGGDCVAVGQYRDTTGQGQVMEATESGGSWAQALEVALPVNNGFSPKAALEGVSCSSTGNCSAVGSYTDISGHEQAMSAAESAGTWGQATEIVAPANYWTGGINPGNTPLGVSCTAPGECAAVGRYSDTAGVLQGMVMTEAAGTWSQAAEFTSVPSNDPEGGLNGVACTSPGECVAGGTYTDNSQTMQAMVGAEQGGTWGQGTEITAPPNATPDPGAGLNGMSCTSTGNCVAVGRYFDGADRRQAMEATEVGGTWGQVTEIGAPGNAASNPEAVMLGVVPLGRQLCGRRAL